MRPARSWVLLAGLCAGCVSFESEPRSIELAANEVTLPSWTCASFFLIDARLDGRGPYTFLLDTGAAVSVVSPRVAADLAGSTAPFRMGLVDAEGSVAGIDRKLHVSRLVAGPATLCGIDAVVLDLSPLDDVFGRRIDGLLGYPAFTGCTLVLDYPRRAVRVSRRRLSTRSAGTVRSVHGSLPVVHAGVAGYSLPVLLDSGSTECFALPRALGDLPWKSPPVETQRAVTLHGAGTSRRLGRLRGSATVGGWTVQEPIVEETDGDLGRIGAQLLRHFVVRFDPRRGLVSLERPDGGPITIPPRPTIGILFRKGPVWTVWDIAPDSSAAAAGVRSGERVLSVQGRDVATLDLCSLTRLVRGRKELRLRFEDREVVVSVAPLVD